jgi:hypothetical protein
MSGEVILMLLLGAGVHHLRADVPARVSPGEVCRRMR